MRVEEAVLASWQLAPLELLLLVLTLVVYLRGAASLRRQMPERFAPWRAWSFSAGLLVVWVASASPLDAFASFLLWVHMVQHLLLMFVAPPLLWLGAPASPMLRGLPASLVHGVVGPVLAAAGMRKFVAALTHPIVCWLAFVVTTWVWHLPALYELALRNSFWHGAEHICFLAASLLFWWPIVQPFPSKAHWPRLAIVPYLLLASMQMSILAAVFSFRDTPLYATYAEAPRISSLSALADQALAGALMWVPGSIVLLVALFAVVLDALAPPLVRRPGTFDPGRERRAMFAAWPRRKAGARFDLLAVPVLGAWLRSATFRRVVQLGLAGLAILVVADGFFGPQASGRNLAGVLPWTYWRAFVVLGLLVLGNVFCFACPFLLPRELARRLLPPGRAWPRAWQSKWFAVVLLLIYFMAYEVFGIWDSPYWTAWIVVGYFATALVVDSFFAGASFCKYVCPIGQFHFIQSMVSPFSIEVRDTDTCGSCRTRDCLVGNDEVRGCELDLYLPAKVGNLDCTFCLDCVRACPSDNIGLLARLPAAELVDTRPRASLGRLATRPDLAALALLLIAAAFVGALAMTAPFVGWQRSLASRFGFLSPRAADILLLLSGFVVLPALLVGAAGLLAQRVGRVAAPLRQVVASFVFPLVPLGFAMWAAHFLFHFVAGWNSFGPVLARLLRDLGYAFAPPFFVLGHAVSGVQGAGLLLLDIGLLVSLWCILQRAREWTGERARAPVAALPFAVLAVALFLLGVWITFQPMQMRGLDIGPATLAGLF
ncbi:MAG: cytochrome c oxidase assembly protein [Deltaproteobacteria bacterium]